MSEALLTRALTGDEEAFRELFAPYQRELLVHCYRMLGSVHDAEDMVQETLTAAWRGLAGFEGRASLRAWLYRIATNRCLNTRRRPPPVPVPPFEPPEPTHRGRVTWLQPFPDSLLAAGTEPGPEARYEAGEAIELGFIAALQQLPPRQVAAVVLHDVLGFRTAEVAGMLGTTETAIKACLQRARSSLSQRWKAAHPREPSCPSATEVAIARRFADAFQADDIDGVVGLLTERAWLAMPPAPHEYQGRAAIASFMRVSAAWRAGRQFRLLPTRANGHPAFGCYLEFPLQAASQAAGLIALAVDQGQICAITRFLDNSILPYFGLPQHLAREASWNDAAP